MRLFLVLCSFAAIANAKPQGYNYGAGSSGGTVHGATGSTGSGFVGGLSGLSGGLIAPSGVGGIGFGSLGGASSSGPSFGGFQSSNSVGGFGHSSGVGAAGGFGSGIGGGFVAGFGGTSGGFNAGGAFSGIGGQQQQQQHSGSFEAPIVHKQFISISAPEDHETLEKTKHFVIGRPQKNYRVVFIKAPTSSAANVKLSAEYAPKEEKTVIYVLSKKDSTLEVNDIATPAPTLPTKPEVVFIKYKTEEEARHAQQQIQAEYDKIEGTSEHTDGGIGQQQSVVGILGGNADGAAGHGGVISGGISGGIGSGSSYTSGSSSGIGGINGSGFVGSSSSNSAKSTVYLPPAKTV